MSISVCTIVKNEADGLKSYVKDISAFADEIILVDNGSTDGTYEIAKSLGCTVQISSDEFDEARNQYLSVASCDWIMTLDIDERIDSSNFTNIKESLRNMVADFGIVACPRNDYFGNGHWSVWILPRYIRNQGKTKYQGAIHGSITKSTIQSGFAVGYIPYSFEHFDGILHTNEENYAKRMRNVRMLKDQITSNPYRASLYSFLGHELAVIGECEEAVDVCKKAISIDTDHHTRSAFILSAILSYFERYEESIVYADMQVDNSRMIISGKGARAERAKREICTAKMLKAKSLFMLNRKDEAISESLSIIKEAPELIPPYINLYFADTNRFHDYLVNAANNNPIMLNPDIYVKTPGYTLYEVQDMIAFDYTLKHILDLLQ